MALARHLTAATATWLLASAILLALPVGVAADNFGGPLDPGRHCDDTASSQCVANNATHTVCLINGSTSHKAAIRDKIDHWDSATDLIVNEATGSCTGYDVHTKDVNQGLNGIIAAGECAVDATYGGSEANRTRWCRPQVIKWNTAYNYLIDTATEEQMVACHELGHTAGLRHRRSGEPVQTCMTPSDTSPVYVNPYTNSSTHDRGEVNAYY
jgi:hypothetical protein